jgi:hypothetical protein
MTSSTVTQSKIEVSWDQVMAGNFPESPAKQLFTNTVIQVAADAKAALPEANGRVERARDLVLGNLVSKNADGTYTVRSASARGKHYTINGECNCPDAEKLVDKRCKHRIAVWIWRKARQVIDSQMANPPHHQAEATDTPQASATQAPAPAPVAEASATPVQACTPTHHEAPASMNTYVDIEGYRVQVTFRTLPGEDEMQLHRRMAAYLKQFPRPEAPPAAATPPAEPPAPEGYCRIHNVHMQQWPGKDGRKGWYSHRLPSGEWCKGK